VTTEPNTIRRVDAFAGLFTACLGAVAVVQSVRMPRFPERGVDPYTVPGVTPGLIGSALIIFGLMLTIRALRGASTGAGVTIHIWQKDAAFRIGLTLALALTYGLLLFGNVPFVPATVAFVFAFTVALERINPDRKLTIPVLIGGAALLGLGAGFGIDFVFREVFLVRFPG
jgi:putative tricarboxylic transport membrane protein